MQWFRACNGAIIRCDAREVRTTLGKAVRILRGLSTLSVMAVIECSREEQSLVA